MTHITKHVKTMIQRYSQEYLYIISAKEDKRRNQSPS